MKRRYKILFLLILIIGITAAIMLSPLFEIENVVVNGISILTKEEITEKSQITYGANIFRANLKNSRNNILKNPYVDLIKIKRKLPNTIIIDIIEREPMAVIEYLGSWLVISSDGIVLEVKTEIPHEILPTLIGIEFEHFEVGIPLELEKKQLDEIVAIIKAVQQAEFAPLLSEIDVKDIADVKFKSRIGIKIILGGIDNIEYKVKFAKSILEDASKTYSSGTIDMSHAGNPIFRIE